MSAPKRVTAVLLALVMAALGEAQAPPFKILDGPIPRTAIGRPRSVISTGTETRICWTGSGYQPEPPAPQRCI